MFDTSTSLEAFAVLERSGRLLYCSPSFAHLVAADAAPDVPLAGSDITDWFAATAEEWPQPDGFGRDHAEGIVRHRRRPLEFRYRLEPMAAAQGAILHLRDERLARNLLYATAFKLNPGLSAISVLETGEHLDVNQAWLDAMEYRREEVIGRTAREMDIWEDGDGVRHVIVDRLRRTGRVANLETRMRTRTGALRDIIVSAELVEYSGRKLAFFASHDITEVKRAEAALRGLNRDLETRVAARTAELAAKNDELAVAARRAEAATEAKSRFLSMMSHEIRTPLNAVINMTDLLLEAGDERPDPCYLTTIASAARSLSGIVDDILDFSRIEAGHLEIRAVATDVGDLIEEVTRSVAPLAHRKGVDVALTIPPTLPAHLLVDPLRLRQILFNLIGNAVKYTDSGWVHVIADMTPAEDGDRLAVEVIDTGVGIDPADHDSIFERFFQAGGDGRNAVKGTGLGLSISQGLASAMGGAITMRSARGRGSAFRLDIPAPAEAPPAPVPALPPILLLGPPSRPRHALETMLTDLGAEILLPDDAGPGARPATPDTVALLILPVSPDDGRSADDWLRPARARCRDILVHAPIGKAAAELAALDGLHPGPTRVETHPVGWKRLAAALRGGARDEAPALSPRPAAPRTRTLDGARILIVDDTDENRLVAEACLKPLGALVESAASGEAAVRLAAEQAFDLVLLDLRMAGLDGYDSAAQIRKLGGRAATLPIIAVSANIAPDQSRMEAAGIGDFLAKPFRPGALRTIVEQFLKKDPGLAGLPTGPERAAPDGLDPEFLDYLLECAGPDEMIAAMDGFLKPLEGRLSHIGGDAPREERRNAAHKLAGAAGALGLIELSALCKDFAHCGQAHGEADMLASIQSSARRSIDSLERYRRSRLSSPTTPP